MHRTDRSGELGHAPLLRVRERIAVLVRVVRRR
jgi:hypothetical protein